MKALINITELENGNLLIKVEKGCKRELKELVSSRKTSTNDVWCDLLEPYSTNGGYSLINPEDIGALTDAPIITDELVWDESDERPMAGEKVWWFPNYAVENELETLIKTGEVIFTNAE